jgi:hypothetical protein
MLKIRNAKIEDLPDLVVIEQHCFTKEEALERSIRKTYSKDSG